MNFLKSAFSEASGKPSSHRMLVGLSCVTVMGVWAFVSVSKKDIQPLGTEPAMIVLGGLGISAYKRGKEGNAPAAPV